MYEMMENIEVFFSKVTIFINSPFVTVYYRKQKIEGFIRGVLLTSFLNYGGNWYENRKNDYCRDTLIVHLSHGSRRIYSSAKAGVGAESAS